MSFLLFSFLLFYFLSFYFLSFSFVLFCFVLFYFVLFRFVFLFLFLFLFLSFSFPFPFPFSFPFPFPFLFLSLPSLFLGVLKAQNSFTRRHTLSRKQGVPEYLLRGGARWGRNATDAPARRPLHQLLRSFHTMSGRPSVSGASAALVTARWLCGVGRERGGLAAC